MFELDSAAGGAVDTVEWVNTFAGAFSVAKAEGCSLREATEFANAARRWPRYSPVLRPRCLDETRSRHFCPVAGPRIAREPHRPAVKNVPRCQLMWPDLWGRRLGPDGLGDFTDETDSATE